MTPPRVFLDLPRNTLELRLREGAGDPVTWEALPATLDIGEAGRLLGIELDLSNRGAMCRPWRTSAPPTGEFDPVAETLFVPLDAQPDGQVRSATTTVRGGADADGCLVSVEVPRRGVGFEISYPSGNR